MSAPNLTRIAQIAIAVTDLQRAVTFYRDVLGLQFLFQAPPGLAFFDVGGVRLMLDGPARVDAGRASIIYYRVADLTASHAALVSRGVVCDAAPHLIARLPDHELWMAFFRDPDRNPLALMSEVRPEAAGDRS